MRKSITIRRALLVFPVLFAALTLSGCGTTPPPAYQVNLEMWGPLDDSDAYQDAIVAYQGMAKSHIKAIEYKKKAPETYREDLLNAFAAGNGPDIFLVRSSWLPLFKNLIAPAPAYQTTEKEFRDGFIDVVANDLVVSGKVYGAPMTVDSLALYYNKDLFNAAGITSPPSTWDDVIADSRLLNSVDANGKINMSAISLGTAKNINRSTDILLALATQYGLTFQSNMFYDDTKVSSDPMRNALSFYSGFAGPGSDRYSWNANQHYSVDAFYEGNLAMMVNYSWQIDAIKKKNPKLNFAVAPLPQISATTPSNYVNYWVLVVAKDKKAPTADQQKITFPVAKYNDIRVHESWQFLHYLTFPHPGMTVTLRNALLPTTSLDVVTKDDPAKVFLEKNRQPSARRDLIEVQKNDPWLAPFATGNLIAKDWRVGEVEQVEGVLAEAIDSVNRGENTVDRALPIAETQITQLQRKVKGN